MKRAQVHRDAFALTGVLLQCLELAPAEHRTRRGRSDGSAVPARAPHTVVRDHVARTALELLDAVTLVTERPEAGLFAAARDALDLLHTQLDLVRALAVLEEHDFVDLTGQLETIGAGLTRFQDEVEP